MNSNESAQLASKLEMTRKQKREAEAMVRQLEQRIELSQRRVRMTTRERNRQEEVLRRRSEVLRSRELAKALIDSRKLAEERRLAELRAGELQRREQSRSVMYDVFCARRSQAVNCSEEWTSVARDAKVDAQAMDLVKKQSAAEQRELHRLRRQEAQEKLERQRSESRKQRLRESEQIGNFIRARGLQRAKEAKMIVHDTHQSMRASKDARWSLIEERRRQRAEQLRQATRIEEEELHCIADRLAQLQSMERQLHAGF